MKITQKSVRRPYLDLPACGLSAEDLGVDRVVEVVKFKPLFREKYSIMYCPSVKTFYLRKIYEKNTVYSHPLFIEEVNKIIAIHYTYLESIAEDSSAIGIKVFTPIDWVLIGWSILASCVLLAIVVSFIVLLPWTSSVIGVVIFITCLLVLVGKEL
jgi:hypothetical protein